MVGFNDRNGQKISHGRVSFFFSSLENWGMAQARQVITFYWHRSKRPEPGKIRNNKKTESNNQKAKKPQRATRKPILREQMRDGGERGEQVRWSHTQMIRELGKRPREKRLNHTTRISWSSGRMTKSVSSPRKTAELILIWSDEGFRVDALNLSYLWEFHANPFCLHLSHKELTKWAFLLLLVPVQSIPKGWKSFRTGATFYLAIKVTILVWYISFGVNIQLCPFILKDMPSILLFVYFFPFT